MYFCLFLGKLESWLDLGPDYFDILQEGYMIINTLRKTENSDISSASIRDEIYQVNFLINRYRIKYFILVFICRYI